MPLRLLCVWHAPTTADFADIDHIAHNTASAAPYLAGQAASRSHLWPLLSRCSRRRRRPARCR